MTDTPVHSAFYHVQEELGAEFGDWDGWLWTTGFGDRAGEYAAVRDGARIWDCSALIKWDLGRQPHGAAIRAERAAGEPTLASLAIEGDEVPDVGAEVTLNGTPVGTATSPTASPRLGTIALAILDRASATPGTRVEVALAGGSAATRWASLPCTTPTNVAPGPDPHTAAGNTRQSRMPDHLGMDASEYLEAAESIIRAGARLGARGLIIGAEGNLSIRLGDQLLVTPSGRRKDELSVQDLLLVPLDPDASTSAEPAAHGHGTDGMNGTPAPRPSSDIAVHRAVYRARPDVRAVAHAHLAASLGLTLAGERPNPDDLPETRLLLPRLPFVPLLPMGSSEIAAAVASALTEPPEPLATAVLQERHGAVTVGETLEAAVDRLELVDLLCRVRRDALLIEASRRAR